MLSSRSPRLSQHQRTECIMFRWCSSKTVPKVLFLNSFLGWSWREHKAASHHSSQLQQFYGCKHKSFLICSMYAFICAAIIFYFTNKHIKCVNVGEVYPCQWPHQPYCSLMVESHHWTDTAACYSSSHRRKPASGLPASWEHLFAWHYHGFHGQELQRGL